jgi:vacuolar-type H+-ATPase subunit H
MWPLRRRRSKATEEATKALKDAEKNLHEVKERGCEVRKVATALKEIRERNHFAEQLEAIILRNGGTSQ